jgi:hypothetical protein
MTPAERLRAKQRARQAAQRVEGRWQELTPAERLRVKQRARQDDGRVERRTIAEQMTAPRASQCWADLLRTQRPRTR